MSDEEQVRVDLRERARRTDGPVHLWFSLSYCSYAVQPRSVLQSMPVGWQERFVALMNEAEEMGYDFPGVGRTYNVQVRDDESGRFVPDRDRVYRHVFVQPKETRT